MKSNHKTFTLIELILVIGIVALLAGAMIPTITSARRRAHVARLLRSTDTIRKGCIEFNSDTGGYPVSSVRSDAGVYPYEATDSVSLPFTNALSMDNGVPGWSTIETNNKRVTSI